MENNRKFSSDEDELSANLILNAYSYVNFSFIFEVSYKNNNS